MNTFQIIALGVLTALFLGTLLLGARRRITRRESFLWASVCLTAAVATLWPELTSALSRRLGIGRGADLVSYLGVVAMMIGFWWVHLRMRHQEREITLLVRRLALMEGEGRERRRA